VPTKKPRFQLAALKLAVEFGRMYPPSIDERQKLRDWPRTETSGRPKEKA
jgi:hypothetical protein